MTRGLGLLVIAGGLVVAACTTHPPRRAGADAATGAPAVELRGPRGELLLQLAPLGGDRWELRRPDAPPLAVVARAAEVTVAAAGAPPVVELRGGPSGLFGNDLRVVVPAAHGYVRVLDGIGVTRFSADPGPAGGSVGRDESGSPVLEARAERDRVVVERPGGGARLATVHRLPGGPDATLAAAVLATDRLPFEVRAAVAAYVLSR